MTLLGPCSDSVDQASRELTLQSLDGLVFGNGCEGVGCSRREVVDALIVLSGSTRLAWAKRRQWRPLGAVFASGAQVRLAPLYDIAGPFDSRRHGPVLLLDLPNKSLFGDIVELDIGPAIGHQPVSPNCSTASTSAMRNVCSRSTASCAAHMAGPSARTRQQAATGSLMKWLDDLVHRRGSATTRGHQVVRAGHRLRQRGQ
jgi:hypothetical protein